MTIKKSGLFIRKPNHQKVKNFIAWDLETTPIKPEETPRPLFLTAYGKDIKISEPIQSYEHLGQLFLDRLLIPKYKGFRFVSYNGNRFDNYIVSIGLLKCEGIQIIPLIARDQIRGIVLKRDKMRFTLDDGMSMLGFDGSLNDLATQFLGEQKEKGVENGVWNGSVEYAENDSRILYESLEEAQKYLFKFGLGSLQTTAGSTAKFFFRSQMPEEKFCRTPPPHTREVIHKSAYRGGFAWADRQYKGKAYKYDINSAYPSAMRKPLPSGRCFKTSNYQAGKLGIYHCEGVLKTNVPFYFSPYTDGLKRHRGSYACKTLMPCWLASPEIEQLKSEGAKIKIISGYFWEDSFSFKNAIDQLEKLRAKGGALKAIAKAIGNSAYGKFAQRGNNEEYQISHLKPSKGWFRYDAFGEYKNLWVTPNIKKHWTNDFYQPQLSTFISAYVRMELRRAIIKQGAAFLYCDTDSMILTQRAKGIEIHPTKFGAWKCEAINHEMVIVGRKTYADLTALNVVSSCVRLSVDDVVKWLEGQTPKTEMQTRTNYLNALFGEPMFKQIYRSGMDYDNNSGMKLQDGKYLAIL